MKLPAASCVVSSENTAKPVRIQRAGEDEKKWSDKNRESKPKYQFPFY
jgi:hypothetical protein